MSNDLQILDVSQGGIEQIIAASRPLAVNKKTGQVQIKTERGMMVNSLLRKDEWEALDMAVLEAAKVRLNAVMDLRDRGLTNPLGSLGVLVSQYNKSSDVTAPEVNMSGQSVGNRDRVEFNLTGVPIPVIFKEFSIGTRQLESSRRLGTPLDTTHVSEASFVVAEHLETMLLDGESSVVVGSDTIYGYTNHPDRNTDTAANYGGGDWGTIANITPTVEGMITAANNARHYGPFVLYASTTQYNQAALAFYTDGSGQTPIQRLLQMPPLETVKPSDKLTDGELVLVQMTQTVVDWSEAMGITVMEWASGDGMTATFKVITVAAPRVKSDYNGNSGIVHATGA